MIPGSIFLAPAISLFFRPPRPGLSYICTPYFVVNDGGGGSGDGVDGDDGGDEDGGGEGVGDDDDQDDDHGGDDDDDGDDDGDDDDDDDNHDDDAADVYDDEHNDVITFIAQSPEIQPTTHPWFQVIAQRPVGKKSKTLKTELVGGNAATSTFFFVVVVLYTVYSTDRTILVLFLFAMRYKYIDIW